MEAESASARARSPAMVCVCVFALSCYKSAAIAVGVMGDSGRGGGSRSMFLEEKNAKFN